MDKREQPSPDPGLADGIRIIRSNAEIVVGMFSKEIDFRFGYDQESVQWLDAYIEHIRLKEWTDEEFSQLVSNLGSYLGEALIRCFGGAWMLDQRGWAVRWDAYNLAYPFIKVAKQLKNGAEDSIYSFFTVTGALRKGGA